MFKRPDSLIKGEDSENLEATIVEINEIFARHRNDFGMNTQFKVSLTPKVCLHAESTSTNQPERRPDGRTGSHAQVRNHHVATLLKIFKPNLRPTETQRQIETTGGSAQNQRTQRR